MKTGLLTAWLTAEGIVTYRCVKLQRRPPMPGELLATCGLFVLLALLAEAPSAAGLATTIGWGVNIAAMLNLVQNPKLFGPTSHTSPASPGANTSGSGGNTVNKPAQISPGGVGLATTF